MIMEETDQNDNSQHVNIAELMKRAQNTETIDHFNDPLSAKKPHLTQTEVRAKRKYQSLMNASPTRSENELEVFDKIKGLKKTDNKTL